MSEQYRRTAAFVDLSAISHNVREVRAGLKPETKVMAIIKADAYGHGAVRVAERLEEERLADAYGVAIAEEGIALRMAGIEKPILLLGYSAPAAMEDVIRYNLTQTVFSLQMAEELNDKCGEMGKTAEVHIKLDTGMGRIGFAPSKEALDDIIAISKLANIRITGIFSHLARADETDKASAKLQFKKYCDFVAELEAAGLHFNVKHIANSAAAMELPEMQLDMVRLGIVTYGLYPSNEVNRDSIRLKPALSWKTLVSYVKDIPAGTPISYGGTFVSTQPMKVATIPIGYADGYPRSLSGKGRVLIHGEFCPILGRICMDQMMVDVSHIPFVKVGDTVTLVGSDGDNCIPIEEPADMSGSFNYEFVCDIGRRVERVYI